MHWHVPHMSVSPTHAWVTHSTVTWLPSTSLKMTFFMLSIKKNREKKTIKQKVNLKHILAMKHVNVQTAL